MPNPIVIAPKRKFQETPQGDNSSAGLTESVIAYINKTIEAKLQKLGLNTDSSLAGHMTDTTTHGATGAIVGTTNTQELTNKTLTTATLKTSFLAGTGLPNADPHVAGQIYYINATGVVMRSAG